MLYVLSIYHKQTISFTISKSTINRLSPLQFQRLQLDFTMELETNYTIRKQQSLLRNIPSIINVSDTYCLHYLISFLVKQCSYFHHVAFFLVQKNHFAVSTLSFVFSVILNTSELAVRPTRYSALTLKRNTQSCSV